MKELFGTLASGEQTYLYTITDGSITAVISDFGATIVKLLVPDRDGNVADVVLGFDSPNEYFKSGTFFGATVGRNCGRVKRAKYTMFGKEYAMTPNDNVGNNLHSGPDYYKDRLWIVENHTSDSIRLKLLSPHGDQGFPGNAEIHLTYSLKTPGTLLLSYDAICDRDTVFNFTNHSYFNLCGHDKPEKAMSQILSMPARVFTVEDSESIPTGEMRSVEGTPMDFRTPKAIGRDIDADYEPMKPQGGYDHNFEVFTDPCAILSDPESGRIMAVSTDLPGIQFYAGNYLDGDMGKGGVSYTHRGGICLETQYYPDAINRPEWQQPFFKAGERFHSETRYIFK